MSGGFAANLLVDLDALVGGLFILSAFFLMAPRQAQGFLKHFVRQSFLLALSALLLGWLHGSVELLLVALITLLAKTLIIPGLLTRTLERELRSRREVELAVSVPASLLVAIVITVLAFVFVAPLLHGVGPTVDINLPIGFAVTLIGVYTLAVRREAVPQMLAVMAIDNGAFFAGIAIASSSAIVELAAGLEGVVVVLVVAILARTIAQHVGSTAVGDLTSLKEGTPS